MAFDMSKAAFGKASVSNLDKVQKIPLGLIKSNEQNFYSIEGIDELSDSIAIVGLLEPVRVVRIPSSPTSAYQYKLISGHRRFRAFMNLYSRKEEGYLQYAEIPALIMEDMDDLSETFALITANSTARELSYAEKLKQEQLLRETLTTMKEAGKPVPKNLGQYIADQIGTSRNEVSRMHSINENLIPEAREQVDKGEMTAQQAYELSRKPEEQQRETVAAKRESPRYDPDASMRQIREELAREEALTQEFADIFILPLADSAIGRNRQSGIDNLRASLRHSGLWGTSLGYDGGSTKLSITKDGERCEVSYASAWDALALAAMRRCAELSKLDTEEDKPSPAGTGSARVPADAGALTHGMWHTPEDPPKEDGSYVCMYRGAGDDGFARRTVVMEYKDFAWRMYGHKVEDVYTILKWTEVPEC